MSHLTRVVVSLVLINSLYVRCNEEKEKEKGSGPVEEPYEQIVITRPTAPLPPDATPSLSKERQVFRELFEKYENLENIYHDRGGTIHPEDIEDLRKFYAEKKEELKRVSNKDLPPEQRCIYLKFVQYLKKLFLGVETPPRLSGDKNCPWLKTVGFLKKYVCANEKKNPTDEDRKKCPYIKASNFISENRNLVIGALVFFAFLSC